VLILQAMLSALYCNLERHIKLPVLIVYFDSATRIVSKAAPAPCQIKSSSSDYFEFVWLLSGDVCL